MAEPGAWYQVWESRGLGGGLVQVAWVWCDLNSAKALAKKFSVYNEYGDAVTSKAYWAW